MMKFNSDTETRRLERELATGDLSVVERLALAYARDGRIRDPHAFVFFFKNYGGDVARRIENSLHLARAEEEARRLGLSFHWTEDPDGCTGCNCSSKDCKCSSGEAHETLQCVVRGAKDEDDDPDRGPAVLASLSGVCQPDRHHYRRVVEAELASDALTELAENPRRNVDMNRRTRRNSDARTRALERMVSMGDVSPPTIIELAKTYEREGRGLPRNGLLNRYGCVFVCFFGGAGAFRVLGTLSGVRRLIDEHVGYAPREEVDGMILELEDLAPGGIRAFYDPWIFAVDPTQDDGILEYDDHSEWLAARRRLGLDQ